MQEYLVDLNAKAAAIRAGYSERSAKGIGWELLQRERVREAAARRLKDVAAIAGIRPANVLRELAIVAFGDIRELYDGAGNLKPIHELSPEAAAQIAGLEVEEIYAAGVTVGRVKKLRRSDRVRALEILAKHPALFPQAAEMERTPKGTTIFNVQINIGAGR